MKPIKLTRQALATITAVASMRRDYTALLWGDDTLTVATRDELAHIWSVGSLDGASADMQHLAVPSSTLANTLATLRSDSDVTVSVAEATMRLIIQETEPLTGKLLSVARISCIDWRGMHYAPEPVETGREIAVVGADWLSSSLATAQAVIGAYKLQGRDMVPEILLEAGRIRLYGFTSAAGIRIECECECACKGQMVMAVPAAKEIVTALSKSNSEATIGTLVDGRMFVASGSTTVAFDARSKSEGMLRMLDDHLDRGDSGACVDAALLSTTTKQAAIMSRVSLDDYGRVTLIPSESVLAVRAIGEDDEPLFSAEIAVKSGRLAEGAVSFGGDVLAAIAAAVAGYGDANIRLGGAYSPITVVAPGVTAIAMPRTTPTSRRKEDK